MPVFERDQPTRRGGEHRLAEHTHHFRTGTPGDVEARDGVPVSGRRAVAPLGPADGRRYPQTQIVQVPALLSGGEVDIGARPLPRPSILAITVEARRAE